MISHVTEVWLALFAAFAVGSLLGWLIYRWVDRSDYAFDQNEFTDAAGRPRGTPLPERAAANAARATRQGARPRPAGRPAPKQAAPEQSLAPVAGRREATPIPQRHEGTAKPVAIRPEAASPTRAEQLRARVRGQPAAEVRPAPADPRAAEIPRQGQLPAPQRPPLSPQVGAQAAALLRARSAAVSEARSPAKLRPAPPTVPAESPALPSAITPQSPQVQDEPWPAKAEPWPIERPTQTPTGLDVVAAPGGSVPASGPVSLSQKPSHDEIWATTDDRPDDPRADVLPAGMTPPPTDIEELAEWTAAIVRESDREAAEAAERDISEIGALQPEIEVGDDSELTSDAPLADDGEAIRPPALAIPPEHPDDFKLIKGIGPAFEKRLNEFGIYRYSQIAQWSEAEQDWIGQEFGFTGRIERDDWVGQAAALAERSEAATAEDPALN